MKHLTLALALALAACLAASAAPAADCYADYKAKQDKPLRLHYGVVQLTEACDKAGAQAEVAARLQRAGWTLLNVLSVFGSDGLDKRKANAGPYYLRF